MWCIILETSNILTCSMHPLALLYKSLLSLGKIFSLTINPSILNEARTSDYRPDISRIGNFF